MGRTAADHLGWVRIAAADRSQFHGLSRPINNIMIGNCNDVEVRVALDVLQDYRNGRNSVRLPGNMDSRTDRCAYWISQLVSPRLVAVAAIVLCMWVLDEATAGILSLVYSALTVLMPTLSVIGGVARGKISDFHLPYRHERIRSMLFPLSCSVLGWAALEGINGPTLLRTVAGINALQATLFLVITHCTATRTPEYRSI